MTTSTPRRGLIRSLFELVLGILVLSLVILAVWLASSLAAYLGGPRWAAVLAGVFLCPVLPLAWDAFINVRRRKKRPKARPLLGFVDRMIFRTSIINVAFVGGLVLAMPATAFTALSARGDWMLEGQTGDAAEAIRRGVYFAADRLEWAYRWASPNPFAVPEDKTTDVPLLPADAGMAEASRDAEAPSVDAGSEADAGVATASIDAGHLDSNGGADAQATDVAAIVEENGALTIRIDGTPASTGTSAATVSPTTELWPSPDGVHPALAQIPPEAAKRWQDIATYLAKTLPTELERARAIHDFVADHLAYDQAGLFEGRYGPQDPDSVFQSKRAVCKGYTQLYNAMLKEAGIEARAVVGGVRDEMAGLTGRSHIWSAVRIDGHWRLVDVTWDSPHVIPSDRQPKPPQDPLEPKDIPSDEEAEPTPKVVSSGYFLTPPEIFGLDHYPEEKKWQLKDVPLSRGEFIRQPMLSTGFFRAGFELKEPTRSQVDATGEVMVRLANPKRHFVLAHVVAAEPEQRGTQRDCDSDISGKTELVVRCPLPTKGTYRVLLFSSPVRFSRYQLVAQLSVVNRI